MVLPWRDKQQAGFTLIEMMVVVAIMGIITAMAYPSMQRQIAQMKVRDAANLVETTLKQARSDALIYRSNVVLSATGSTLVLSQIGNSNYPQTRMLDSKITALSTVAITFKPSKTVDSAPANIDFCYSGVSTDKYIVTVDALANISMSKNGVCNAN